jgi:hypothetical protein
MNIIRKNRARKLHDLIAYSDRELIRWRDKCNESEKAFRRERRALNMTHGMLFELVREDAFRKDVAWALGALIQGVRQDYVEWELAMITGNDDTDGDDA